MFESDRWLDELIVWLPITMMFVAQCKNFWPLLMEDRFSIEKVSLMLFSRFVIRISVGILIKIKSLKRSTMYYFIPAWYGQGVEFWQPDMTPWYNRRKKLILMIHSIK